ncbi:cupin domain-containing protein [Rhodobacteraceae bacterium N5(2021)]|uniref:Ribosomal oxygenase 2 n=1 Tax=Gymnodinialimonas phycosphaerae TaxID=2841589 RepID=A0A975YGW0_9RHOB|nr:cupin domain-containing protein [Gymnodinialimonas phycosphaerae]MBY4892155.1 cupin domain-containing protein [Gymnodinialimonas phycosphaerae]
MTDLRPFERLIAPMSAEDFFVDVFGQTSMHLSDRPAGAFDDVLTVADISTFLASNPQPDLIHVFNEDARAPHEDWTRIDACSDMTPLVDANALMSLIDRGMSVRLSSVHRSIPSLKAFCHALEQDLCMPLRANIYITPPGRKALPPHYDRYDVFVLQVHGKKRWALFDHRVPNATLETPKTLKAPSPVTEHAHMLLSPGCLAYVPRGLVHSAETIEGVSIHVTLGLLHPTLGNVLEAASAQCWQDPELREAVPHGYSNDEDKAKSVQAIIAAMTHFATPKVVDQALEDVQAATRSKMIDLLQAPLDRYFRAGDLTMACELMLSAGDQILCDDQDGINMSVHCRDHRFVAPVFARPAIDLINEGARFSAQGLPGMLTPAYKLELVRKLYKVGVLGEVDASD